MGARNAASFAVMEPTRVAALVCGGGGPLPASEGARERTLDLAELVKTVDGMTLVLRSMGTPDEGISLSLLRNDPAALSAAMAGAAPGGAPGGAADPPPPLYKSAGAARGGCGGGSHTPTPPGGG